MQIIKLVIALVILFFYSCNKLPMGTGADNEITIVASNEDVDYIKLYFVPLFENIIYTPIQENMYDLKFIDAKDFETNKHKKNIVILSLRNPVDLNVDLLSNKIRDKYNNNSIFSLYDLYAKNQIIVNIFSHDATKLNYDIEKNGNWIYDEIYINIENNILNNINLNKLNIELIDKIKKLFKIDMLIDANYKLLKNDDNYIWIGRGFPYRWITINAIDSKTDISDDLFKSTVVSFVDSNLTDVRISDYMLSTSGDMLRGLYEHNESHTGGPFFTYKYRNSHSDKLIFISGFVNNPGKNKAYLLFQLETIIKNVKEINE